MNRKNAYQLIQEYQTPEHVIRHCEKVGRIAAFLAQSLKEMGQEVDPQLAGIGGLLHDLVRVVDFNTLPPDLGTPENQNFWQKMRKKYQGMHHADLGAQILREKGFPVIGQVIDKHRYTAIDSANPPKTWEEKLVYYADKRVAHDIITSLEDRLNEGAQRHQNFNANSPENTKRRAAVKALETEIFESLEISPNDIKEDSLPALKDLIQ